MTQVKCEVKGVFVAISDAATVPLVVLTDGNDVDYDPWEISTRLFDHHGHVALDVGFE